MLRLLNCDRSVCAVENLQVIDCSTSAPLPSPQKWVEDGDYVRRWCPELARLADEFIRAPFSAPPEALANADVELGHTYPQPVVDHKRARTVALASYQ